MKVLYFLLVSSILLFSACEKSTTSVVDEVGDVEVIFKAFYGSQPFVLNDVHSYDGKQIRISNFQFFVSDLKLGASSNASEIDEIEFVNFSQLTDLAISEAGLMIASAKVPSGSYPGISLGIGVLSDLNAQTPDEYAPTHPLSEVSRYWSDWNSYIFLKLEGTMDTDNDGMFDDVSFVYHVGSDPTYESIEVDKSLSLEKDGQMSITVEVDLEKLLIRDGQPLDIEASPRIHSIDQLETGHYLMDNFANAITIK